MKRIMILGGGENQLPLVKSAKDLGYYVIVCDMRKELEGVQLADLHIPIDYMQREKVLRAAEEQDIDGIISNSEPAMLNVAYVSQALGLPGNSVESIDTLLSKAKFRQLQKKAGVFAPEHFVASTVEELLEKAASMRYPVIVKPEECSGTRGTTKLTAYQEDALREAFSVCAAFSRNGSVSLEEYVEMTSLRVNDADVFVVGDEILWDGTLWEDRSPDAPMLPMTEIYPMALPEEDFALVRKTVDQILKTSGVRLGEYNVETYFTTDHQVFVIEINPRQAGNYIPQLIKEHTGVDMARLLVSTAVGDMRYFESLRTFERENNFITCQVVFAKKDGIYQGLHIDPEVAGYVQWIKEDVSPGTQVSQGSNAGQALAFVDMKFPSYEVQHRYTDDIEQYIYAEIM